MSYYPWNDSSLKCCLCANVYGVYQNGFYNFFSNCINGVKINEVMSNMFPYSDYSRANMNSQLICQCCYTQAEEMSLLDRKWVNCFKQMDAIKNQFSHLRGRNDFDYFLSSTASRPSTSALPSTSFTGNQYSQTSSAPSTSFTRDQNFPTSSAPPSTIVSGIIHNEDNSDNFSTSSESESSELTDVNENENNEEYSSMMMASTQNTCIDIMSNRVYSKAGAFYSCIIPSCRLFFKTLHKFKMHYRHHRKVNGMMCWTCLNVYSNMSELRKHKYQDSCKFPGMFVCVLCNKSFNDVQSISHHKYIKHINN